MRAKHRANLRLTSEFDMLPVLEIAIRWLWDIKQMIIEYLSPGLLPMRSKTGLWILALSVFADHRRQRGIFRFAKLRIAPESERAIRSEDTGQLGPELCVFEPVHCLTYDVNGLICSSAVR